VSAGVGSAACGTLGICDPLAGLAGGVAGDTAKAAAGSVFSALSSWLATGADQLLSHVLNQVAAPTVIATGGSPTAPLAAAVHPDLTATWFIPQETLMVELMALVMFPLLAVSTIGAIAHQDLSRLGRTWLVSLPLALLCGFVGIELTTVGLKVTDALSSTVLSQVDLAATIGVAVEGMSNPLTGPVVTGAIAFLALVAAILLWLELVLRSAAVYIAVLFWPLAMAGLVWPSTTRMAKRLIEMLAALLLAKFVVAAVLALGVNAVSTGGADGAITGVAILLLAGFAPFLLFRMVPVIEAAAIGHLEGAAHRPLRAAQRGLRTASTLPAGPLGAALGLTGPRGGGAPFASAPVAAQPLAQREGDYTPGGGPGASSSGSAAPVPGRSPATAPAAPPTSAPSTSAPTAPAPPTSAPSTSAPTAPAPTAPAPAGAAPVPAPSAPSGTGGDGKATGPSAAAGRAGGGVWAAAVGSSAWRAAGEADR
jgi:hypothetical protein